jgi:hypothetical protein
MSFGPDMGSGFPTGGDFSLTIAERDATLTVTSSAGSVYPFACDLAFHDISGSTATRESSAPWDQCGVDRTAREPTDLATREPHLAVPSVLARSSSRFLVSLDRCSPTPLA